MTTTLVIAADTEQIPQPRRTENRRRLVQLSLCVSIMAAAAVAAVTTSVAAASTRRAVVDAAVAVVVRRHRCRHNIPAPSLSTPRLRQQ